MIQNQNPAVCPLRATGQRRLLLTLNLLDLHHQRDSCQLAIDRNTVGGNLKVSEDERKVTYLEKLQSKPDHPGGIDRRHMLCRTGLTGRRYWEVEWRGSVDISVSYRGISRDWRCFAYDLNQCWSLRCSDHRGFSAWYNDKQCVIISSSVSNRVAVYVDYPAGILSFYRVSSDSLIHLHTFKFKFTEPLYPGFSLHLPGSSVFLCLI